MPPQRVIPSTIIRNHSSKPVRRGTLPTTQDGSRTPKAARRVNAVQTHPRNTAPLKSVRFVQRQPRRPFRLASESIKAPVPRSMACRNPTWNMDLNLELRRNRQPPLKANQHLRLPPDLKSKRLRYR